MKYWQLQKLCLENAYTVKREGRVYTWKKNGTSREGVCDTVLSTAEEIKRDLHKALNERKQNDLA